MKYLLTRPGFLAREYMEGRRARYLNPVKKYVFTSAVFFLFFFSIFKPEDSVHINLDNNIDKSDRAFYIKKIEEKITANPADTQWNVLLTKLKDSTKPLSIRETAGIWDDFNFFSVGKKSYKTREEYDSVQKALPPGDRDNWIARKLQLRNQELKKKYRDNPEQGAGVLIETILHKLPYLLFVSLPVFALILKLLYIRRKKYYYADHGIFSVYQYIFTFFLLLITMGLNRIGDILGWGWLTLVGVLVFLSGGIYLFIAMRRFYEQGFWKTLLKFILLNTGAFLTMVLLLFIFMLFSVFTI